MEAETAPALPEKERRPPMTQASLDAAAEPSAAVSTLPPTAPAAPAAAGSELPKLKFNGSDRFLRELRKRVDAYFERTGHRRRDCPQMYFKTATILTWFFSAY